MRRATLGRGAHVLLVGLALALVAAVLLRRAAERIEPSPTISAAEQAAIAEIPLLRGTLTLVDADEGTHLQPDGSFTLFVLRARLDGYERSLHRMEGALGRRTVEVRRGMWEARVPLDACLCVRELVLDGTAGVLAPLEDFPLRVVPPELRLDLVARALHVRQLRVLDATTGVELEDVRVLEHERVLWLDEAGEPVIHASLGPMVLDEGRLELGEVGLGEVAGLRPRADELPGTWLRGASPLAIPVERERIERWLVVHAPGFALVGVEIDVLTPGVVEVPMTPAGTLRVCVGPDARRRNLHMRVGGSARDEFGWHVPLSGDERRAAGASRHEWYELDGPAWMELASDGAGKLVLEFGLVPNASWRATLAYGQREEGGFPPSMSDVIEELTFEVRAGETTEVELAGCE